MAKSPFLVGHLDQQVVDTFNLSFEVGQEIYCGENNIQHMKKQHPDDFKKYYCELENIIKNPDFIARHPRKKNAAIEYIKVFENNDGEHVLVAVRATGKNQLFARTLFVMDQEKVDKYTQNGAFIPYN